MRFGVISSLLALVAAPAFAQTAASTVDAAQASPLASLVPFAGIFIVFFLLVIRPQMRQAKQRQLSLDALKKGDTVVTGGGAVGKITKLADDLAYVEIATGIELRVLRSSIQGVYVKPDAATLAAQEQKRSAAISKNDNSAPSKDSVANDN